MKELLEKGELKNKLRFLVMDHNPEIVVSQNIWDDVYHFYKGYSQCFFSIITMPIDKRYAKVFILEETFNYLLKIVLCY